MKCRHLNNCCSKDEAISNMVEWKMDSLLWLTLQIITVGEDRKELGQIIGKLNRITCQ